VVRAALACQLRHRHASKPRHGSNAPTDDNPGRDHEHVEQLGDGGQHWLDDRSHDRDGQDYEDYLWQAVAAAAVGVRAVRMSHGGAARAPRSAGSATGRRRQHDATR